MKRREFITQSGIAATALALPTALSAFSQLDLMSESKNYDVVIIGGSYAGLSAAMALGRALRRVLIIDSGLPCNRNTPYSHNFITQDGEKPGLIAEKAKDQVLKYSTVKFHTDLAVHGTFAAADIEGKAGSFEISTQSGARFNAPKLIFATGVKDHMPDIKGYSDCWGISVIHCPYCHGYEVKNEKTGILANGDIAFHFAQLIRNWTKDLAIFTNGKSTLSPEQTARIRKHNIPIIEKEIAALHHDRGKLQQVVFKDNSSNHLKALYARPHFDQHCNIPETLGCELTEQGLLKVDMFQKTSVPGVFACGDNASPLRAVSYAVATGTIAGAVLNNTMTEEEF